MSSRASVIRIMPIVYRWSSNRKLSRISITQRLAEKKLPSATSAVALGSGCAASPPLRGRVPQEMNLAQTADTMGHHPPIVFGSGICFYAILSVIGKEAAC